jgi:amino acid transporter
MTSSGASDRATAAAAEQARDRGLDRGIGAVGLGLAIVNGVIGAGIFRLPADMASVAGALAPLAYLFCAVGMGAVVLCFAEAGSRVPTSGGTYGSVEAAFGPAAGFVVGVLLWLSAVLACGGVVAAAADALGERLPVLERQGGRAAVILLLLGSFGAINVAGVRQGTRFVVVATLVKLVPLGLFIVVGALLATGGTAGSVPAAGGEGLGRAVILALFAFSGMETALATSGEVSRPARNIPLALIGAMLFVLAVYVAIQLVAERLLGAALVGAKEPLAAGMATIGAGWAALLALGALLSRMGWIAGDLLGAPRFLFAFGRDGMLPAVFGRIHPRTQAPWVAIVFHAGCAAALALTGSFVQLAVLAGLGSCGIYALGCAAAWRLRRRGVAMLGAPLAFRATPVAAVIGIAAMAAILFQAKQNEIIGFFAVIAVSLLWSAVASAWRRRR